MVKFNSDVVFIDTSGQMRSRFGGLTLRGDDSGTADIIVGSGESLRPETDCRGPLPIDLGRDYLRWNALFACSGNFLERLTVNGSGVLLQGEGGATILNDLLDVTTVGLFTPTSGQTLLFNGNEWVPSGLDINNVIFVESDGDDTIADGTIHSPYASVKTALIEAATRTPSSVTVWVAPGVYVEDNPMTIPSNTTVRSIGEQQATTIVALNPSDDIFHLQERGQLAGLALVDAPGGSAVTYLDQSGVAVVQNVTFNNCARGIDANSGLLVANNLLVQLGSVSETVVYAHDEAHIAISDVLVVSGVTVGIAALRADGTNALLEVNSLSVSTSVDMQAGILVENGATCRVGNSQIDEVPIAVLIRGSGTLFEAGHSRLSSTSGSIVVEDLGAEYELAFVETEQDRIVVPSGYRVPLPSVFIDRDDDDKGLVVHGELLVGRPEEGSETNLGEGDSYIRGMTVFTTDSTATSTTDGGNLTDVTSEAQFRGNGTFSFQGTAANHTILIGTTLATPTDALRHFGLNVINTIAAVQATEKSFAFDIWNGSEWEEIDILCTHSSLFHRYGNNPFLRTNSDELIHYGINDNTNWQKKTISGLHLYWSRIRLKFALTTSPTFDQIRLVPSHTDFGIDGTKRGLGNARWKETLLAFGNVFGESGGVLDSNPLIGSGALPTGWNHDMKTSEFGSAGDAIYAQFALPRGIDTSRPINIRLVWQTEDDPGTDSISFIVSFLPLDVVGVPEADPAGGVEPVPRTQARAHTLNSRPGETHTEVINLSSGDEAYLNSFLAGPFRIADQYESDIMTVRIELDDDGVAQTILLWAMEVEGSKWTPGARLDFGEE